MEATSVFVKTPDGRAEVRSREHRLSPRERATLIMIDGQRCLAELRSLSPIPNEVDCHLRAFLDAGLITLLAHPAIDISNGGTASADHVSPDGETLSAAAPVMPVDYGDLENTRRYIRAVAQDTLGADAGDFLRKLALSDNKQELLDLAHHLRGVLNRFVNSKEADQFWETVREITPKT